MNKYVSKIIASGILTAIFGGMVAWAGTQIVDNKTEIAVLKKQNESLIDIVKEVREEQKEMREDIKILLQRRK